MIREKWYLRRGTGISPTELEFPATKLTIRHVRSGSSTEPEVRWWYAWTAEEVEWKESTAVRYLMQRMLPRPYTLECTQQALVSGYVLCSTAASSCGRVNCDKQDFSLFNRLQKFCRFLDMFTDGLFFVLLLLATLAEDYSWPINKKAIYHTYNFTSKKFGNDRWNCPNHLLRFRSSCSFYSHIHV